MLLLKTRRCNGASAQFFPSLHNRTFGYDWRCCITWLMSLHIVIILRAVLIRVRLWLILEALHWFKCMLIMKTTWIFRLLVALLPDPTCLSVCLSRELVETWRNIRAYESQIFKIGNPQMFSFNWNDGKKWLRFSKTSSPSSFISAPSLCLFISWENKSTLAIR